jgi:hypothetical protein
MEQCEQCGDSVPRTRDCEYCGMALCLNCFCNYHPCTTEIIETDLDDYIYEDEDE